MPAQRRFTSRQFRLTLRLVVLLTLSCACGRIDVQLLPLVTAAPDGELHDGGLQDGALQDGALQDGTLQDGTLQDGGACVGDGCTSMLCEAPESSPSEAVCHDACPSDPNKTEPGLCGCGQSEQDTDLDGIPDCTDRCSGREDLAYTPDADCGAGYCRAHNTPSTCVRGVETACTAGTPVSNNDASCDGIDDDCDGQTDEDFASTASSCGNGVCAALGSVSCSAGNPVDSCLASAPTSSNDATCDGRDDDCDGQVDEDVALTPSVCAMGACAAMGTVACVNGKLVDSCQPRGQSTPTDTTCDNLDDDCDGRVDEDYVAVASNCGVGVCARTGMRTCVSGSTVDSCVPGARTSVSDTLCNGLDDDCDGMVDDNFVVSVSSCGLGACLSSGSVTCVSGASKNSCVAKTPTTNVDDATSPGNGIDDDCDGQVDEDVPACDTTPRRYEAGAYNNIAVPGSCRNVSIRIWGGGGASGQSENTASGGAGGPGGYATASVLVAGAINVFVGGGAANNCDSAGTNAGSSSYSGGSGGTGTGDVGADGSASGGGSGGRPSPGLSGGDGHYGGGGGGQAGGSVASSGSGGGGGAASVVTVNGVRAALAGGGGGGGGALWLLGGLIADNGGAGGSGCRGNGLVADSNGGGGGGGGACQGASTQSGAGTAPASSSSIPSGRANGGSGSCAAGGPGYAILTFAP